MDKKILETQFVDIGLSIRSYNCLRRIGVETLGDLLQKTPSEIKSAPGIVPKCINEIFALVYDLGLELKEE